MNTAFAGGGGQLLPLEDALPPEMERPWMVPPASLAPQLAAAAALASVAAPDRGCCASGKA